MKGNGENEAAWRREGRLTRSSASAATSSRTKNGRDERRWPIRPLTGEPLGSGAFPFCLFICALNSLRLARRERPLSVRALDRHPKLAALSSPHWQSETFPQTTRTEGARYSRRPRLHCLRQWASSSTLSTPLLRSDSQDALCENRQNQISSVREASPPFQRLWCPCANPRQVPGAGVHARTTQLRRGENSSRSSAARLDTPNQSLAFGRI